MVYEPSLFSFLTRPVSSDILLLHMPHPDFKEFISPANRARQLLQSHFLALQLIVTPVTKNEWAGKDRMAKHGVTSRRFGSLHRDIPEDMKVYY